MPSIGSVDFTSVQYRGAPAAEHIETSTRPGVDGIELRKLGTKGQHASATAKVGVADVAAYSTLRAAVLALKGATLTITDSVGVLHENIAITHIQDQTPKPAKSGVGGMANMELVAVFEFECRDTSVAP